MRYRVLDIPVWLEEDDESEEAAPSNRVLEAELPDSSKAVFAKKVDTGKRGPKPRLLDHNGVSLTIVEWAAMSGLQEDTIYTRLKRGWPVSKAVTEPEKFVRERGPRTGTAQEIESWRERTAKLRVKLQAKRAACEAEIQSIDAALAELPDLGA